MAEKAPCSCGCGKLVSGSTDHRHRAGKTTPRAKATCLTSREITATTTTTKFHLSRENSPQRKRQRTNPGPLPPLKIQDRGAIRASGSSVNDVPPTANMAVDMESVNAPLSPLLPNHSETETGTIEPAVNPCAEAWTNAFRYRATVEDADSDDDDEEEEEESDGEEGGAPSSESEDGRDSSLSDSDSSEDGLGIEDTINDEFERALGNFGTYLNVPSSSQFGNNVSTVEELTDEELAYLRHYALKVETQMTNDTFSKLAFAFPESTVASWKITKARAEFLATFRPVVYDCCISSCCCFVGPNSDLTHCPYCHEPRFNSKGRARRRFTYAPLTPRLKAFYQNKEFGQSMLYRSKYQHDGTNLQDVMDGANYQRLQGTNVTINGQPRPYKYFEDHRDIALGLSTDGFCPFRKRKKTCWPILIYNYNLSPQIRFWIRHILCVGVVPGPYKPKDFDSFLWPLVEELLKLAAGIKAFDLSSNKIFALRAFLILVFGDIPAVSMVMRMKGHNGLVPCRMCKITALRTPNSRSPGHYVPLHRARHPTVKNNNTVTHVYDPANLPLRTHADFLETARAVQMAPTTAQSNILAKNSGIKGIPILSYLPSLFFPYSFPYDFMHLIFENVMKNLILLWTGEFKGLDEGTGQYHLMPKVWEAVGTATAASGSTIPSAFGARPPNVCDNKMACTADTWSFWMLYLGPVLLSKRFQRRIYFDHFIELVKLIHICIQFKISTTEISTLREGFQNWVLKYEQ
jgi:hypothetical protein